MPSPAKQDSHTTLATHRTQALARETAEATWTDKNLTACGSARGARSSTQQVQLTIDAARQPCRCRTGVKVLDGGPSAPPLRRRQPLSSVFPPRARRGAAPDAALLRTPRPGVLSLLVSVPRHHLHSLFPSVANEAGLHLSFSSPSFPFHRLVLLTSSFRAGLVSFFSLSPSPHASRFTCLSPPDASLDALFRCAPGGASAVCSR